MIDWALETYTLIGEEQPQELMDRHVGMSQGVRIVVCILCVIVL